MVCTHGLDECIYQYDLFACNNVTMALLTPQKSNKRKSFAWFTHSIISRVESKPCRKTGMYLESVCFVFSSFITHCVNVRGQMYMGCRINIHKL